MTSIATLVQTFFVQLDYLPVGLSLHLLDLGEQSKNTNIIKESPC